MNTTYSFILIFISYWWNLLKRMRNKKIIEALHCMASVISGAKHHKLENHLRDFPHSIPHSSL
jgi:hypothetical protein